MFFIGCRTDEIIPDELQGYNSKMVVNAVISAGEPVQLELTTSEASISPELPGLISDAIVTLNTSAQTESMTFDGFDELYKSGITVGAGQFANITISHPDYPNVNSTITLPDAINATGSYIEDGGIDTSGLPGDLLQVTFNDQQTTQNYYKLNIFYFNQTIGVWVPLVFDKSDPSLTGTNTFELNDAGLLFTDILFNGRQKTISTVAPSGLVSGNTGDKYRIVLSSVSRDFYKYITSLQRARDARTISFNGGFNNAVVIHSNITNGLGILGSETKSDIILK